MTFNLLHGRLSRLLLMTALIWTFAGSTGGQQCGPPFLPPIQPPPFQPSPPAPAVGFSYRCIQLKCTFVADSFQQPAEADIRSYAWDFGHDNQMGAGPTNVHDFPPGTFTVKLTVTYDTGALTVATRNVVVQAAPTRAHFYYNAGPNGTLDPYGNPVGLLIYFIGDTVNPNHPYTRYYYEWTFGDGTPLFLGGGSNPTHYYAQPGTYIAKLYVSEHCVVPEHCGDPSIILGEDTAELTIIVVNRPPTPDFTSSCTQSGCTLDASLSRDDGQGASGIASYETDADRRGRPCALGRSSGLVQSRRIHMYVRRQRP